MKKVFSILMLMLVLSAGALSAANIRYYLKGDWGRGYTLSASVNGRMQKIRTLHPDLGGLFIVGQGNFVGDSTPELALVEFNPGNAGGNVLWFVVYQGNGKFKFIKGPWIHDGEFYLGSYRGHATVEVYEYKAHIATYGIAGNRVVRIR